MGKKAKTADKASIAKVEQVAAVGLKYDITQKRLRNLAVRMVRITPLQQEIDVELDAIKSDIRKGKHVEPGEIEVKVAKAPVSVSWKAEWEKAVQDLEALRAEARGKSPKTLDQLTANLMAKYEKAAQEKSDQLWESAGERPIGSVKVVIPEAFAAKHN